MGASIAEESLTARAAFASSLLISRKIEPSRPTKSVVANIAKHAAAQNSVSVHKSSARPEKPYDPRIPG
jgi:hypothetical protein